MALRVVVLGGGYGGLSFVRHLAARHGLAAEVTLVDRNAFHTLLAECHTVAAGTRPPAAVQIPFRAIPGVRLLQATVTGLDAVGHRVLTDRGPVPYDALVIALGSVDNSYGIPGVAEHAAHLRGAADAVALRERVAALPPRARVVVAGGGLTGVELAAELALRRLHRSLEVTVVEAAPALLPSLPENLQERARRRLGALAVNVLTGQRIERVDERLVHLAGGGAVPYDLLVWAAGVKGHPLLAAMGLATDGAGRALVDEQMRASLPDVWVVGDCAATALPPTAQAAEEHGRLAAASVSGRLAPTPALDGALSPHRPGALPVPAWKRPPSFKGFLISLGAGYGIGYLWRRPLTGLAPALLKRLIELRHRLAVAGLRGLLG